MKNLFYSLPDHIMYLIHKKVFSDCVLQELLSRPGNFTKYLVNERTSREFENYAYELEKSYRRINKHGPHLWNFLKRYTNFMWFADRYNPMYRVVIDSLSLDCEDVNLFKSKLETMTYIARFGWNNYVNSVTF